MDASDRTSQSQRGAVRGSGVDGIERRGIFDTLFHSDDVGIVVVGQDGRFLLFNDAAPVILGLDAAELAMRNLEDPEWRLLDQRGNPLRNEQRPSIRARVGQAPVRNSVIGAFNPRRGEHVWLLVNADVRKFEDGTPRDVVMTFRDIGPLRRAEERQRFLAEAGKTLAGALDPDTMFDALAKLAVPFIADSCTIAVLDADGRARPVVIVGSSPEREADVRELWTRAAASVDGADAMSAAMREGRGILVENIAVKRFWHPDGETRQVVDRLENRSYLAVPLIARGRTLGAISLGTSVSGRTLVAEDLELAQELASRAALALDNAQLYRAARTDVARREAALRVARSLAAESDVDNLLYRIVCEAVELVGADDGGICRWYPETGSLIGLRRFSDPAVREIPDMRFSLSGRAAAGRRTVVSADYQVDVGAATRPGQAGARAGMAAPLLHEGQLVGTLSVSTRDPSRTFDAADVESLEQVAMLAAAALVGLQQARRQAVRLAAGELAHLVNNKLAVAAGTLELLERRGNLLPHYVELVADALDGLRSSAEYVRRLHEITSLDDGAPTTDQHVRPPTGANGDSLLPARRKDDDFDRVD
jgi:PAS domain S-box-containing protein